MKHRLTQTLLGFLKPVKGSPPVLSAGETSTNQHDWAGRLKVKRLKPFRMDPFGTTFRRSLRLGFLKTCRDNLQLSTVILLTGIQLLAGMGVVRAGMLVTNTAGLLYTDSRNHYFTTIQDTASILVMEPPNIVITKDVYNVRTGETSPDIVVAIRSDTIEFILRFTNTGETDAFYVVMSDSIPAGTTYIPGTATDTNNLDPIDPPDTITFQHAAGGLFDINDTGPVTAIRWEWNRIDSQSGNNARITRFRVRVQ